MSGDRPGDPQPPGERTVALHYRQLEDTDSQTSPAAIRSALERALREHAFDEPILDVGTGIGANLTSLASRGMCVGTDVSFSALRLAGRLRPVLVADGARLPFRSGAFGAALCTEVLEHVDDPSKVLGEIARVLRPGGLAFVTTPNYSNLAGVHKWIADRRSGRSDWNPWGAHEGGHEAFMTGRKLARAARPHFDILSVQAVDYGQALTGRFGPLDRLARSRPGQRVIKWLLPRLHAATGGPVPWHGMNVAMLLRAPGSTHGLGT